MVQRRKKYIGEQVIGLLWQFEVAIANGKPPQLAAKPASPIRLYYAAARSAAGCRLTIPSRAFPNLHLLPD